MLLALWTDGNSEGRQVASDELFKMATLADKYVELVESQKEKDGEKQTKMSREFQLTRDAYDGIIEMASYGISYWAAAMDSEENGCHFTDADTGKEFFIKPKDVEKAVLELFLHGKLNDYYQSAIRNLVVRGCGGDVGSDIADAIIQQACFGEVIYG